MIISTQKGIFLGASATELAQDLYFTLTVTKFGILSYSIRKCQVAVLAGQSIPCYSASLPDGNPLLRILLDGVTCPQDLTFLSLTQGDLTSKVEEALCVLSTLFGNPLTSITKPSPAYLVKSH